MARTDTLAKSSWIMTLASVAVVVGALYLAKGVLLPVIMAILFTFLLTPACDWLERRHLGRMPAVLVTVILTFAAMGVIAWTAISQMSELAPKIAEYQGNIEAKFKSLNDFATSTIQKLTKTTKNLGETLQDSPLTAPVASTRETPYDVRVISTPPTPLEVFGGMFGTVLEALASTGIVILLVLFFLFRREDLRDRFIRLVGQGQVTGTTQALNDAATRVARYLFTQFAINIVFGIAVTIGLYLVGIPNAILWGILTSVLKFIPYIGVWIAALFPVLLSMAISTRWMEPIMAAGVFVMLEFIVGNFMEPWLFGKHTGVSAVAILVAAVFWSWLWGGVGLLLATPLTVCLLVLGKHVPQLQFLYILLGNEPVFDLKTRIYQRLLAGDQEEASELIDQFRKDHPLIEVYDTALVPVLYQAEKDRLRDEIDHDRLDFILSSVRDLVEDLGETERETLLQASQKRAAEENHTPPIPMSQPPRVLCVAAASEADEIVTAMLAQLVEFTGCEVRTISMKTAVDQATLNAGSDVELVYISAMPPAAVTHARQIRRRLQTRFGKAQLVVGLWNYQGDLAQAASRLGSANTVSAICSLNAALLPITQRLGTEPVSDPVPPKDSKRVLEIV
ncbi:MAG: AI-2E family transporter [Planctomycetota bacterium]